MNTFIFCLAAALGAGAPLAVAQPSPAPANQAPPPVAPAKPAQPLLIVPPPAGKVTTTIKDPPVDKPCLAATRKLEREQNSLDTAQAEVTRYRKMQQGCPTKTVCARYAAALTSLDKRIARHQRRIDRFGAAKQDACKRT